MRTQILIFGAAISLVCAALASAAQRDTTTQQEKPKTRAELLREAMKDPTYRAQLKENMKDLQEMMQFAEKKFGEKNYREAASFYQSVTLADIPNLDKGVSPLVEEARNKLIEMEGLAQQKLRDAEDADLARNYLKAVEELTVVVRDFPFTKAKATAESRLAALGSRKDVAAYVEFAKAEAAEASGDLAGALKGYLVIVGNPRFEGTVPVFKAKKRIEVLKSDESTRDALKKQLQDVADKEAPPLMNSAKNFLMNNRPKEAKDKYRTVVEKFPGSTYAEEAQKEIEKLQ